eukprot:639757-Prymnesium_polylepis.1
MHPNFKGSARAQAREFHSPLLVQCADDALSDLCNNSMSERAATAPPRRRGSMSQAGHKTQLKKLVLSPFGLPLNLEIVRGARPLEPEPSKAEKAMDNVGVEISK